MKVIKNQEEANDVFKYLIDSSCKFLGISEDEANKRLDKLLESKLLNYCTPDDLIFAAIIDYFMQKPSES